VSTDNALGRESETACGSGRLISQLRDARHGVNRPLPQAVLTKSSWRSRSRNVSIGIFPDSQKTSYSARPIVFTFAFIRLAETVMHERIIRIEFEDAFPQMEN
jgi:hypothetical protein